MRSARLTTFAALAASGLLLSACTNANDQPRDAASPMPSPSLSWSGSSSLSSPSEQSTPSGAPSGAGTSTATPTTASLSWTTLPGTGSDTVISNGTWLLTTSQDGDWWSLDQARSEGSAPGGKPPKGLKVVDAQLDDDWAVAVYGSENDDKPQRAVVTSLKSGKVKTLDASSDLPPSTEGSWALDGSTLWHPTEHAGSFCLAATDLSSMTSTLSWCAPPRNGFNSVIAAAGATSMLTFDGKQPSCRTVVAVSGSTVTPFPDVPACKGAEGAVLGSGSTATRVWSVVPNEHQYQRVRVYASTPSGTVDLGAGVNSTLTVCGSAAYWARDASGSSSAALMRWDGSHLSVAYESKGYLGKPLCAGHVLSIAEQTDNGTQQLAAPVS